MQLEQLPGSTLRKILNSPFNAPLTAVYGVMGIRNGYQKTHIIGKNSGIQKYT